jgi:hypothetical protein
VANPTWLELSNDVFKLAGMAPLTASQFNSESTLEKPYIQGKYGVRLGHMHMSVRGPYEYAKRRIPLPLTIDEHTYEIDTGVNPSAIQFRTFFCTTAGSAAELKNWTEQEFRRLYPDDENIPTGSPTHWILLAPERTDESAVWRVRIFPTPDASYQCEFKAKLIPYELTQATSVVLWPAEYRHVLIEWAWHLLERGLGEGKESYLLQLAKEAFKDVQVVAGRPDDERRAVRTMKPITHRMNYPNYYPRG